MPRDDLPGRLRGDDDEGPNVDLITQDHSVVTRESYGESRERVGLHSHPPLTPSSPYGPRQRTGKGVVYEVRPPKVRKRRHRKSRKRRKHRAYHAGPPFARYRERDTILVKPRLVGIEEQRYGPDLLGRQVYNVNPRPQWDGSIKERTWDEIHPGPPYLVGGPFRRIKVVTPWYQVQGRCHVDDGPFGVIRSYDGGFVPTSFGESTLGSDQIHSLGVSGDYGADYGDPSGYGAEGWRKFKPKLQDFEGLVGLIELKDLPGMVRDLHEDAKEFHHIWKGMGGHSHFFGPKGVADKFLQYQFGWAPFVGDIQSAVKTYRNLDTSVKQAQRDNGTWVRRHGTVLKEDEVVSSYTDELTGAYVYPALDGHLYRPVYDPSIDRHRIGKTTFTHQVVRRISFAGSFRYYIPSLDVGMAHRAPQQMLDVVNRLRRFGVRVSPTVLYKAFPWTWLADWFVNGSAVVDNLSGLVLDGMVSKYAYIMERRQEFAINDSTVYLRDGRDIHCLWYQEIDSKRREEAHPFGLSWSEDPFTTKQLALLTALGLSRG